MRMISAACASLLILAGFAGSATAEIPSRTVDVRCRKDLHRAAIGIVNAGLAELSKCHKSRMRGDLVPTVDCNDTANALSIARIPRAQEKMHRRSEKTCQAKGASDPIALGLDPCPSPCDTVAVSNNYDGVANCLICLSEQRSESMMSTTVGTPPFPASKEEEKCQLRVANAARRYVIKRMRAQQVCQKKKELGKIPVITDCKTTDERGQIARAEAALSKVISRCDDATLASLNNCGGDVAALQTCALTTTQDLADALFDAIYPPIADIVIISPVDGAAITDSSFLLKVALPTANVDPASLQVSLNGQNIPLLPLGDGSFELIISAGPPLLDANTITVNAMTTGGQNLVEMIAFSYEPPKARVSQISSPTQLIAGPLAQGQVGDYLLENGVARFIVQDVAQRGLSNVGTYGGNLIDAELLSDPGRDEFLEIQPMVNVESVINAQTVEIVNDGQDGTAAILRTCGPDDLLDFVNISSNIKDAAGLELPDTVDDRDYEVEGCTEYSLEAEATRVRMETTIFNNEALGIGLFVGDIMAAGGALDPWAVRTNNVGGIGEVLLSTSSGIGFIGQKAASGLAYSYVPVPLDGGPAVTSEVLGVGGVTGALHNVSVLQAIAGAPAFIIESGGSASYSRYFGIGAGGGSIVVDDILDLNGLSHGQLAGCVTVAGDPAPGARVAISPSTALTGLATHFVTDATGCFVGDLRPGTYTGAAAAAGTLFETGSNTPFERGITMITNQTTFIDFDLPAPARINVQIVDENSDPMPGRVSIVGFDAAAEQGLSTPFLLGTRDDLALRRFRKRWTRLRPSRLFLCRCRWHGDD